MTTLAAARGTTPADLVARLVRDYVAAPGFRYATMDEVRALIQNEQPHLGPDSIDAMVGNLDIDPIDHLVGKYSGDAVNDIDAVVYDR